ncbi:hypothetical protein SOV_15090 [Sporomusa ovata DSM 2662]|uniref:hypothetical protein n=1 Tax=Sporomusa ovata TaxID=2378 RepID=UPI0003883F90|nr:hypothetical protein [Sporomusa ovata]EQB29115.1 hypothetical protein SOV_1c08460 [Sporomusa ovata DSM 2662]
MANKKPAIGNGKNFTIETPANATDRITESPRTNPTQSNYQVSNDTISASDLQSSIQSSKKVGKAGG